ncbi:YchJ family protein [Subtercola frigoramans]|uniref:SEC-C motif-containing protein n=1 Tax=Subtercola frigoramans TaxID=120298 RepID=A0ABS2L7L2_9MICO|nr:YchJ family metal-binding protein [Subtercola frigoramans]MBM7473088.1 SEC-C motif-containing protein [Subtercola frigoramans]
MTGTPAFAWPQLAETDRCPCLSGLPYGECCAPAHSGAQPSLTAERLMRSRYSAFVLGDEPYLLATWHSSTRPVSLGLDPAQRFYRLDILSKTGGGMLDRSGTVEFVARFRLDGRAGRLHETSRFVSERGCWFYVDGILGDS